MNNHAHESAIKCGHFTEHRATFYGIGNSQIAIAKSLADGSWRILRRALRSKGGTGRLDFATRREALESLEGLLS